LKLCASLTQLEEDVSKINGNCLHKSLGGVMVGVVVSVLANGPKGCGVQNPAKAMDF
jgi:hypothetical protein